MAEALSHLLGSLSVLLAHLPCPVPPFGGRLQPWPQPQAEGDAARVAPVFVTQLELGSQELLLALTSAAEGGPAFASRSHVLIEPVSHQPFVIPGLCHTET